jgi:tripartite ATP-independent transporter DctP family solute receptor
MFSLGKKQKLVGVGVLLLLLALAIWFSVTSAKRETPTQAPAAAPVSDVRTLRLGLNLAAGSALHAAAVRFAEQIGERTKGKLKVEVYPDQKLGSDDQMLEMARNGKLDLLLTPTAKLSSAIPAMQYADLPFYFSGRDELYAMLDGEPGQLLLSKLGNINLVGLTFWENGFKQFTANTPIHAPRDFAKLRIRTMKSPLINDQFASVGAQPIPIDFHATYQALKDGAVDGQENPLVAIVGMRFHEVQKHLTISNHAYLGYVFSASKTVFETLSPDVREIIQRTARELTLWEREETARRETDLLATIRAAGVNIYTLSAEERQHFAAVMAPVADKFGFEVGYDLLAKTEELRFAKSAKSSEVKGKAPLLIGLDADLSARGAQAGGAIYRGMQMAIDEINQKGGVLGAPLRVIARDHGADSATGRRTLEYFAAMPAVVAVVGGMHSAVITDELDDIHRLKIPYLIPWAAAQGLTLHDHRPSYTFRVSINDSHVAPFLLEHALKLNGPVAVLLERSAWGRSNEAALKPLIDKLPAGTVEIEWLTTGDPAIEARIAQLVKGGKRSIVLVANGIEARTIVQAMAKQEKPVPIFAHWALVGGDFWSQTQAALQRVDLRFVQSILMDETAAHPNLPKLLTRYRQRYGLSVNDPIPSLIGTAHAYDLTHLLVRAVTQAKSTDRAAVRTALESLRPYSGVLREYSPAFTKDNHDALDRSLLRLARFDNRGRVVLAK